MRISRKSSPPLIRYKNSWLNHLSTMLIILIFIYCTFAGIDSHILQFYNFFCFKISHVDFIFEFIESKATINESINLQLIQKCLISLINSIFLCFFLYLKIPITLLNIFSHIFNNLQPHCIIGHNFFNIVIKMSLFIRVSSIKSGDIKRFQRDHLPL